MDKKPSYRDLEKQVLALKKKLVMQRSSEKRIQILFDISNAVNTTVNLDELYESIHYCLNRFIDLPCFFIAIVDGDGRQIRFPCFKDDYNTVTGISGENLTEDRLLVRKVIAEKTPVFMDKEAIYQELADQSLVIGTIPEIWAGFPLKVAGKVIGVMAVQSYTDARHFSGRDFDMFVSVSDQVALAIERKKNMDELKQSEQRFRNTAELLPEGLLETDINFDITYVNKKAAEMFGYTEADIAAGVNGFSIIASDGKEKAVKELQKKVQENSAGTMEFEAVRKDGTTFPVLFQLGSVYRKREFVGWRGIVVDISDRKRWEKRLRESEYKFRTLAESTSMGIMVVRGERIIYANKACETISGYAENELLKMKFWQVAADEYSGIVRERGLMRQAGEKVVSGYEARIVTKQGVEKWVFIEGDTALMQGETVGIVSVIDISTLKQAEQAVIQADKKGAVGSLAAGIALEMNNPITGMVQNAQLVKQRLTRDLPSNTRAALEAGTTMESVRSFMEAVQATDILEKIIIQGERASRVVDNMMAFADGGGSEKSLQEIPELMDRTIELAASDYDLNERYDLSGLRFVREYEKKVPSILCWGDKIQQVFFNLIKHRIASLYGPGKTPDSPVLTIRVLEEKKMIRTEIEDNGPAMDEESARLVFEPFFTPGEMDRETGLGLSVSYFIVVDEHAGEMAVQSGKDGTGTCFVIRLPAA
ncbi:MAG: PAS domain S-box protein [Thermodesulfobacteriota bacterium]